jgi:hypothetical protein
MEESLGSETIVCRFSENNGTVNVSIEQKSAGPQMEMRGPELTPLRGTLV